MFSNGLNRCTANSEEWGTGQVGEELEGFTREQGCQYTKLWLRVEYSRALQQLYFSSSIFCVCYW